MRGLRSSENVDVATLSEVDGCPRSKKAQFCGNLTVSACIGGVLYNALTSLEDKRSMWRHPLLIETNENGRISTPDASYKKRRLHFNKALMLCRNGRLFLGLSI